MLPGGIRRNCPGANQHPGPCSELQLAWEGPSGLMLGKAVGSGAALVNSTPAGTSESLGVMKEERWERSTWEESQEPRRGEGGHQ